MNNQLLIKTLNRFNFDSDWSTQNHVHGLCNYPARMHPNVVSLLIENLAENNSLIFDAYCGSGTVLVEAMLSGKNAIGTDVNPLASLITKVKTTPINSSKLSHAYLKIERDIDNYKNKSYIHELPFDRRSVNLNYWFKDNTIKRLSTLHYLINTRWIDFDKDIYDFVRLSFARLVREVSSVRKNEFKLYRVPAEKLKDYTPRVFDTFLNILQDNMKRMNEFYGILKSRQHLGCKQKVYSKGNEELHLKSKVDLVITSPPYGDNPTTVTYGQFSRYPLLWLGFKREFVYSIDKFSNSTDDSNREEFLLGNSKTYVKTIKKIMKRDSRRADDVAKYFISLTKSFQSITNSIRKGGKLCVIIGPRTVRNVLVPNHEIVKDLASYIGLEWIHSIERNISFKSLPHRNSIGSTIHKEYVVILEKE